MNNKVKPMLMQLAEPEYMCPECGNKFYLNISEDRVVINPFPTHCNCCNKEFDWTNNNNKQ